MREFPTPAFYDPDPSVPTTPWEAMLQEGEPVESTIERSDRSPVYDALADVLTSQELDILELHSNQFSVRDIAEMLGISKTTVHRKLPGILATAAEAMSATRGPQADDVA